MRLAVLTLVQAPYWEPLYHRLHQTPGLSLRVLLLQGRDSLRGWSDRKPSYPAVQLPCLTPEWLYPLPVAGVINRGLEGELRAFQPDCIVLHGYSYLAHLQAARWAIRHEVPYLLWGDSNAHTSRGPLPVLKDAWLDYFCRHAAGALAIGASSREFWSRYGIPAERQFWSPLTVDNDFFAREARSWRGRRGELRQQLGLPPGRLLLYAGRLAPTKNLERLLHALARHRASSGRPLNLALVGDGPERSRLERLIGELRLDGVFRFGFQKQQELAKFYALADALVLPSLYEPWGLVVNEAMAAGLPVLVAHSAGCRPDLVEEGGNGFSFDETDTAAVAGALDRFSQLDDADLERMGARSAERISHWTIEQSVEGFHQGLRAATGWQEGVNPETALPGALGGEMLRHR
jgi:glycosyltransferase involved in cell wall biosynthesis